MTKLDPKKHFFLTGAFFARPILGLDGALDGASPVVNPASLHETDPLTGVVLAGFPKVLVDGTSLAALASFSFEQILDPLTPQIPLVPRNAAVVLQFSQAPDFATLALDDGDPSFPGLTNIASNIQVRFKDGTLAGARVLADPSNPARLVVLPVAAGLAAWPASPLSFDSFGNPVEDPQGFLRIVLGAGLAGMASVDGRLLSTRADKLGSVFLPLPFNPGNSQLDAILLQDDSGTQGFNGFLPDLSAPRIVRPVDLDGTVASILGNELRDTSLGAVPNTAANEGQGEWANSLLTITSAVPGGTVDTQYVVVSNEVEDGGATAVFRLAPGESFHPSVIPGDAYHLSRAEFFEPIPPPLPADPADLARVTVDPLNQPRDPLDPQDLLNSDLRYFVRVFDEFDVERTDAWDPSAGLFQSLPPRSSLRLTFSEAMDAASFRPYESFFVCDALLPRTDAAFQDMRIGAASASVDGRTVTFAPFLVDQVDPDDSQFIGFGGSPAALRLVLRTIPDAAVISSLKASATPDVLAALVDIQATGVTGCTDLGGRGLGLPAAVLDQGDPLHFMLAGTSAALGPFPPAVDFSMDFETLPTDDPDYGAIVHRFMGQATTSIFTYPTGSVHDTVTQGIEYTDYPPQDDGGDGTVDRRFIYGPTLVEVGLSVPGRLTGAAATTIEHLIDNFNKPKRSTFASPDGQDFLISVGFGVGVPLNSTFGARFQHVYRAGDASPDYFSFRDSVLDLVGLAWSPFNNFVNPAVIEDMEIRVGLSSANRGFGPNTNQVNGIPQGEDTGLVQQFDCNMLEWITNCLPDPGIGPINDAKLAALAPTAHPMTTVVKPGTPYAMSQAFVFRPANSAKLTTGFNYYHPFPTFNAGLDPIFGQDDVFSYPYDSNFPMLIEYQVVDQQVALPANVQRFSPGILSSVLPRFRVWSQGQNPLANCVPNWTANVGLGPYNGNQVGTFRAGEGGPLIEPGLLTQPYTPTGQFDTTNGMPTTPVSAYILPPYQGNNPLQPEPDWVRGMINADDQSATAGCITAFPQCNTDPYMNWYFANGMLLNPLPNLTSYPGPEGAPPTRWKGYGVPQLGVCGLLSLGGLCPPDAVAPCIIPGAVGFSNSIPPLASLEPNMTTAPAIYGDNSRHYMLWKYKKRVSVIESPTIESVTGGGSVRYLRPLVDPPLAEVDPLASLRLEVRAGPMLDFAVPQIDSGYVDVLDPSFGDLVSGASLDRNFVKFRASFGVAKDQSQPPTIDTVVIPFVRIAP